MINFFSINFQVATVKCFQSNFLKTGAIISFGILFSFSCKNKEEYEPNSQGFIEYDITYLQNGPRTIPNEFLPKKMVSKFRDNSSYQKLEGVMGFFSYSHLVIPRRSINKTFLQIRKHKYFYKGSKEEMAVGFDKMEGLEVTFLNERKQIAGFEAKKARISFIGKERDAFDVYYTEEISIKNPNATNPFKDIPGVLLEFQLKFHNLNMHFIARNAVFTPISRDEFKAPDNFKVITRTEMERIIGLLLE